MAAKSPRPGRTLFFFFIGLVIAYGLVAINGSWKPQLGLDLRGGTRITLIASGSPDGSDLDEARSIIDQRVNGSGVTEASVTTQGSNNIQVEVPGRQDSQLVQVVEQQAELRFRLVACDGTQTCGASATTTPPTTQIPNTAAPSGNASPSTQLSRSPSSKPSASSKPSSRPSGSNRAPSYLSYGHPDRASKPSAKPTATPSGLLSTNPKTNPTTSPSAGPSSTPSSSPTSKPSGSPSSSPSSGASSDAGTPKEPANIDQGYVADPQSQLTFQSSPPAGAVALYNRFTCNDQGQLLQKGQPVRLVDNPAKPIVACGSPDSGNATQKFLLSQAVIEGSDVTGASAQPPGQNDTGWSVGIDLNGQGSSVQTKLSSQLVGDTTKTFAIVLDGQVISSAYYQGVVGSSSQISGNFSQSTAQALATSLKFGSLPISFNNDKTSFETIGPSLAGNQLDAGLLAGAIGLILVMIYCLLYYRGLGVVVIGSLVVAAAITYAMVLLLGKTANFTLTLPGIAGLIIAIGITADSFIILFERIRDERRDGKSLRVAVEAGWKRARNTTLAADGVSLLAAVVLYIFAAGVVKGFAFALGLTTIIDLVVFFWFTKPLIAVLARRTFFSRGHRFSGLSKATLGIDRRPSAGSSASAATLRGEV